MADIERGRKQFLIGFTAFGAFMVLIGATAWFRQPDVHVARHVESLVVFGVLGGLAYRGVYWARGAIVVWLGLIAISDGLLGARLLRWAPGASLLVLASAAALAYGTVFFYTSAHIEAFLLSRGGRGPRAVP
jgi:hypothetical protein